MSKPDWKSAPDWAGYLAMDEDSGWWWFEEEPHAKWGAWRAAKGRCMLDSHRPNWESTLEPRP